MNALIGQGYAFQTFTEFLERPELKSIMLRHDVEAKYENALAFAQIQHDYRVRGTYYFRFLPSHFSLEIIQQIASLGHEIGYHYDDLSYCKGDYTAAIKRFEKHLAMLREIAPVKTICMEGAPLSRYDNRDLWRTEDGRKPQAASCKPQAASCKPHYRDYGIIGEPYFDIDFSKILYLTDTGRRWDGGRYSVRDKVGQLDSRQSAVGNPNSKSKIPNPKQTQNSKFKIQNLLFHSTPDIVKAANTGLLPDQILFTFHPQRWNDRPIPWVSELLLQNVKNVVKRWIVKREQ